MLTGPPPKFHGTRDNLTFGSPWCYGPAGSASAGDRVLLADLLILTILNIYRKYYGWPMTMRILGVFYAGMVVAGYVVELRFGMTGLAPDRATASLPDQGIDWNYTTWLNIVALMLAALLVWRFRAHGRHGHAGKDGQPG